MGEVLSLLASPLEGIGLGEARWVAGLALVKKHSSNSSLLGFIETPCSRCFLVCFDFCKCSSNQLNGDFCCLKTLIFRCQLTKGMGVE